MKIFYYDSKHERVHGEIDLGPLNIKEYDLLQKAIKQMEDMIWNILDGRYKNLILAQSYDTIYDDGEPLIIFDTNLDPEVDVGIEYPIDEEEFEENKQ